MITKTFTYVDFFGIERTEDVRFHLSNQEVLSLELSKNGGLMNWIKKAAATSNSEELMPVFENIILTSYGEISPDGRRFMKGEELSRAFKETPMYGMLIESFFTEEGAAAEFFKGVGLPVEKVATAPKLEDVK